LDSGLGRRRSQRVDLKVRVRLSLGDTSAETETVLVSRHGALVRHPESLSVGTRVRVCHLESGREAWFRVVWAWPDGETEGFKLGLDLVEDSGDSFWGSAYEELASPIRTR